MDRMFEHMYLTQDVSRANEPIVSTSGKMTLSYHYTVLQSQNQNIDDTKY